MIQIAFTEETIAQLRYERYHHPHPRVQQRMEALLLKANGLPHHTIADCVGVCENTLRSYFTAYQHGGIDALKQITFYQPTSALMEYQATIEAYFRQHPPATIAEAAAVIEHLTGIQRKPTQVRAFLQKIGMKRLKTYSIPEKHDTDVQALFKKTNSNRVLKKQKQEHAPSSLSMRHISSSRPILAFCGVLCASCSNLPVDANDSMCLAPSTRVPIN